MRRFWFPFWYLRRGYVMIRVNGCSAERLLSRSAAEGILLREIRPLPDGVTLWVPVGQVRPFGQLCRRYGCRFRLLKKEGFPFLCWRAARHKVMLMGMVLFLLAVPISGLFVWQVEVVGLEGPLQAQVEEFCSQEGLYVGAFRPGCDTGALAEKLLTTFPFLRFASVHVQGTRYTVEVEEKLPEPVVVQESEPAQVVAKVDAVVTEVAVSAGTAAVKAGDVVQRGDMLIDGRLTLRDGEVPVGETLTHAAGRVMGRFEIQWEKSLPFAVEQWVSEGKKAYQILLETAKGSVSFPAPKTEQIRILDEKQLSLPFLTGTLMTYEPLQQETVVQTEQQLEGALWALAQKQEETIRQTTGTIVNRTIHFSPTLDGLLLEVTWTVEGDIGWTEKIDGIDGGEETKDE